ncbi:hypothetical protein F5X98DRAFT_351660 [Xylaria grammica]|nr:hypothetical protein F5X98DRAFT_351660 [Xylaria grammica]
MGRYKRGPYVRSDWRNPNHTYKGVNPTTHPFYHLMEASIGKDVFYGDYLTARATPFGDKCGPSRRPWTGRCASSSRSSTTFIGSGSRSRRDASCSIPPGVRCGPRSTRTACASSGARSPMRTTETHSTRTSGRRAGGSSGEESILDKWTQLNNLLRAHPAGRPFHEHEMVAPYETYGLRAGEMLADETFTLTPRYRVLYERLPAHDRSCLRSVSADEGASERLLALTQGHVWQLTAAVSPHNAYEEAGGTVRLVNTYTRRVGLPPAQVSALIDADADAVLARAATPPGYKAIGVVSKPTRADYGGACVHGATIPC